MPRCLSFRSTTRLFFGLLLPACIAIAIGLGAASAAPPAAAALPPAPDANPDATRAQALLARAVARYAAIGDQALALFSRQGEFIDRELYVYVLDADGVMLASGGSSAALIGRNVAAMRDTGGYPFFSDILKIANSKGSGTVEYRWLNRDDNSVEKKQAYFQKTGDRILAVGYYYSRAMPRQAQACLTRAVAAYRDAPEKAIDAYNDLGGGFTQDDLYVFVIDIKTGRFVAHGASPRLIGTDGLALRDKTGKPIIGQLIALARSARRGQLDYQWPNPVTKRIETKRTLFEVVGGRIIAVGYYRQ